ncbi:M1 family metallopeptidase [Streptomyces xinghaiensis]|uniref:M1 family metallopeptidase n=1 Tax=Streptomyces xinghaiensis TaxID=1038928 RepID=UPI0034170444
MDFSGNERIRHGRGRGGHRGPLVAAVVLAGLLVGVGTSFGTGGQQQTRPPAAKGHGKAAGGSVDVTGYDITMNYQPDSGTLRGVTVVSATSAGALDSFTLHLGGLTVRSVTVDAEAAKSFSRSGEKDLVVVPARTIGPGDRFRVRIAYDGEPGAGWLPTESGGATAFMGSSSAWFPVHEDARDKADFRLTATVPEDWSVIAVGREGPVRREAATATFSWTEPDVDPAHIAVSVDRFTVERSALADGTPVVNAYAPGLREQTKPLADRLPEILEFLSGRFGRYPFRAAGNVFVQVNDDGPATAPQTRPVYLGAGNERFMTLESVVHEQAHQWYGVSAAARRPEDKCLAECFAVYATWLWDEAEEGADLDARYRERVVAGRDDPSLWEELYRPGRTPGIRIYDKGPLALHALRRQVGDEAFGRLLQRWPREHRGEYAGWPRFEEFAEKVTGQDLTGFSRAWFRGATVPGDPYLWPGGLKP